MTRSRFGLVSTILCVCGVANAEIYKYTDEDGNTVFTDNPAEDVDGEVVELESYEPPSTPTPIGRVRPKEQSYPDTSQEDLDRIDRLADEQVSAHQRRCTEARVALEVLHQGMPVYLAEDGQYRAAWNRDAYEGSRIYLTDAQRAAAIDDQFYKLALNCEDPLNEEQQQQVYDRWYNEEHCTAAREDLEVLLRPDSRSPDDAIEKARAIVSRYCGD